MPEAKNNTDVANNLSDDVIQHCWRTFQLGANRGEEVARKCFGEVLRELAAWVKGGSIPEEKCRPTITGSVFGPGMRLHYLNVRYRIEDQINGSTEGGAA